MIKAVYALGHMAQMLKAVAASTDKYVELQNTTKDEWVKHDGWSKMRSNLNAMLRCVWLYLADETQLL
ncbi:MAG: hypothetical protein P4L69_19865 [Desulfosporosinus sp.]|nr:hypothetical protein [Desulfosporosinus sp.]